MIASLQTRDGYLTGKTLVAMPGMADPRFSRAVIYLCAHDAKGAMGLVANNRITGIRFEQLLGQLNLDGNDPVDLKTLDLPVMRGGPVEETRGFLLHSADFVMKETVRIDDTFCVTGTIEALRAIAAQRGPRKKLFILGYAGWQAGQLEKELQENSWLVVDSTPGVIFSDNPEEKWDRAIRSLGIDPLLLSAMSGKA